MGLLDGKVAVVTGAGRGLGRSHALVLAEEGARVVVADPGFPMESRDVDPSVAAGVVAEIEVAGGTALASVADVSSAAGGARVVAEAVDAFGGVDVLVNNAGWFHEVLLEDVDEDTVASDWAVHITGTFATTAAAFPVMAARGGGAIVNTGSSFWPPRSPGFAGYSAAKSATFSFTRSVAATGAPLGIRVNTLIPLAITRQSQRWLSAAGWFDPAQAQEWERLSPRWSSLVMLWLVSPLADGITGRAVQVVPREGVRQIDVRGNSWDPAGATSPDLERGLAMLARSHAGREP